MRKQEQEREQEQEYRSESERQERERLERLSNAPKVRALSAWQESALKRLESGNERERARAAAYKREHLSESFCEICGEHLSECKREQDMSDESESGEIALELATALAIVSLIAVLAINQYTNMSMIEASARALSELAAFISDLSALLWSL